MSDIKLKAANGGGSISLKGPSTAGSDTDFLDTSGNLKVTGNTTVDGKILIGTTTTLGSNADDLNIKTTGNTGISIQSGTTSAGNIYFADGTSGTDLYRGYVSYDHNTDKLVLGTANTTNLSIDSWGNVEVDTGNLVIGTAGKGIDFGATSDAAGKSSEILDDYEIGTWTPAYGTSAVTSSTYASTTGSYIKVGSLVTVIGRIQMSDSVVNGNLITLGGLPYTVSNTYNNGGLEFTYIDNWYGSGSGDSAQVTFLFSSNTTYGYFYNGDGNAIAANATYDSAKKTLHFKGFYYV